MTADEQREIARYLGVSVDDLVERLGIRDERIDVTSRPCGLLTAEHTCSVYPVRPALCQSWPESNVLASARLLQRWAPYCPGLGASPAGSVSDTHAARALVKE